MKVTNIKRIVVEEFSQDDQEMAGKLAYSLNPFLDQVVGAFNKNIDFDNLNQEVITFTVEVNAAGIPKAKTELKTSLKTRVKGAHTIRAIAKNSSVFPTGCPFISFNYSSTDNLVSIQHIAGLPLDQKFDITVILIG